MNISSDEESESTSKYLLPQTMGGRIVLFVECVLLMPLALIGLYSMHFAAPVPQGIVIRIVANLMEVICSGLLIITFFGIVWSIFQPVWAERLMRFGIHHYQTGMLVLLVMVVITSLT